MKTLKKAIEKVYRRVFVYDVERKDLMLKSYEHFDYLSNP